MVGFVFLILILIALLVAEYCKSSRNESRQYLINADWLDHSDKFRLIARWGVK